MLSVVLTIPEAVRLVKGAGVEPEGALEVSGKVDARATPHYPMLAMHEGQMRDYFIVLRHRGQDCIFLGEDYKCSIYSHRPHVCRLYPFDLQGAEVKKGALCPVPFQKEREMKDVALQLREDLHEHGKIARKWNATHKEAPTIGALFGFFRQEGLL